MPLSPPTYPHHRHQSRDNFHSETRGEMIKNDDNNSVLQKSIFDSNHYYSIDINDKLLHEVIHHFPFFFLHAISYLSFPLSIASATTTTTNRMMFRA